MRAFKTSCSRAVRQAYERSKESLQNATLDLTPPDSYKEGSSFEACSIIEVRSPSLKGAVQDSVSQRPSQIGLPTLMRSILSRSGAESTFQMEQSLEMGDQMCKTVFEHAPFVRVRHGEAIDFQAGATAMTSALTSSFIDISSKM